MQVAELFVNLGVKGSEKSVTAVKQVKEGMQEVASSGLAAKAAILAVVYGLEQMSMNAANRGSSIKQFGLETGISTDYLQRLQAVMMNFRVSGDDVASTLRTLQTSMVGLAAGEGGAQTLALIADKLGGIKPEKLRDIPYLFGELTKFAKTGPADVTNWMLQKLHIDPKMFQAMSQIKDLDKALANVDPSMLMGQRQQQNLDKIGVAWDKFFFGLKRSSENLVDAHGLKAIQTLTDSFKFMTELAGNIDKLTKAFPVLEKAAVGAGIAIFAVWQPMIAAISGLMLLMSEYEKHSEGKSSIFTSIGDKMSEITGGKGLFDYLGSKHEENKAYFKTLGQEPATAPISQKALVGGAKHVQPTHSSQSNNQTNYVTITAHDTDAVGKVVHDVVNKKIAHNRAKAQTSSNAPGQGN